MFMSVVFTLVVVLSPQLCSRNAEGKTPFMTAVTQQNYLAAIKIMKFVEEVRRERNRDASQTPANARPGSLGQTWSKSATNQGLPSPPNATPDSKAVPPKPPRSPSPPDDRLLQEAIIAPTDGGMTPVQALFASLSRYYDSKTMCLYIYCVPSAFTAPQLLKLFQSRYPSAYKV